MSHRHQGTQHPGWPAASSGESGLSAKGPPGGVQRRPAGRPAQFWILSLLGTCALLAARPAAGDLTTPGLPRFLPLHSARGFEDLGLTSPPILAQRAIDEEPPKKKPEEPPVPEEVKPETAPELEEAAAVESAERKSPARAFLLSALLPGLGELYVGSPRGYVFMGVEAATWITYASYKSSSNSKEEELFDYADKHFSIGAFSDNCVGQPGQPCSEAVQTIEGFYADDRAEYYEIISKNPIYKPGWGVDVDEQGNFTYENGSPPDCPGGSCNDDFRTWVSDQAAKQDEHYASYNELRDDRNSLDKTARGMTMVALVNHLVSAWDAFALARGFNASLPGATQMKVKFKTSFGNPGASLTFKRHF
jgi:hypothetical protein